MALPLPPIIEDNHSDGAVATVVDDGGQLFCFLPLPTKTHSPTGLRPHVNGCFSVSQNRYVPGGYGNALVVLAGQK